MIIKIFFMISLLLISAEANRGIKKVISLPSGERLTEYTGSYALLIGVSNYTNGWPDLQSIPSELNKLEQTLISKGFQITKVMDPNSQELKAAYELFINEYGYDPDNRLLFFYSGHGYSNAEGTKGFLVPTDAPNPNKDMKNFKRKSFTMSRILSLSREMEAKHALFLFDSCFSGSIFKTRALPKVSPYIQQSMAKPVRQFITSGSAGEEVPAQSVFTPLFSDAISGEADLNHDGYVTGSEIGMFLSDTVPRYKNQSPQYGKIQDYELSRGDFIFLNTKPTQSKSKVVIEQVKKIKKEKSIVKYNSADIVTIDYMQWQDTRENMTLKLKWSDAVEYCSNLSLSQYHDWKLPSKTELKSIVDKKKSPAIIDDFKYVRKKSYWTSSDSDTKAWSIYFYNGDKSKRSKGTKKLVRCVRNTK